MTKQAKSQTEKKSGTRKGTTKQSKSSQEKNELTLDSLKDVLSDVEQEDAKEILQSLIGELSQEDRQEIRSMFQDEESEESKESDDSVQEALSSLDEKLSQVLDNIEKLSDDFSSSQQSGGEKTEKDGLIDKIITLLNGESKESGSIDEVKDLVGQLDSEGKDGLIDKLITLLNGESKESGGSDDVKNLLSQLDGGEEIADQLSDEQLQSLQDKLSGGKEESEENDSDDSDDEDQEKSGISNEDLQKMLQDSDSKDSGELLGQLTDQLSDDQINALTEKLSAGGDEAKNLLKQLTSGDVQNVAQGLTGNLLGGDDSDDGGDPVEQLTAQLQNLGNDTSEVKTSSDIKGANDIKNVTSSKGKKQ
ncbi:hypothetical protein [Priestia endophytica]|uniref:hypothetical protein n=1 Tax=Priestia endophytica TaxID=135735 RepID=UPI000F544CCA|nr:hypothetical protein [Priestia endophytica]MED4073212.1 hypothetical protein [Priestia endophytica]RPK12352.1 hypothetical protein FH5_02557 [Priestia endophytica]